MNEMSNTNNKVWAIAAASVAAVTASQANAAVVSKAINATIDSSGTTGATSATVTLPAIGISVTDNRPAYVFTASAANGVTVAKPTTGTTASTSVFTEGTTTGSLVTGFNAGDALSRATHPTSFGFALNTGDSLSLISADGLTGQFPAGATKYFGFYIIANAQEYDGWIGIQTLSTGSTVSARITDLGLESTPNIGIVAGSLTSVPEPASLSVLALGAAGVLANRRRSA